MNISNSHTGFLLLEVMVACIIFTSFVGIYAWYQGQTLSCYRASKCEAEQLVRLANAIECMVAGGEQVDQDIVVAKVPQPAVTGFLVEQHGAVPCTVHTVAVRTNPQVSLLC